MFPLRKSVAILSTWKSVFSFKFMKTTIDNVYATAGDPPICKLCGGLFVPSPTSDSIEFSLNVQTQKTDPISG